MIKIKLGRFGGVDIAAPTKLEILGLALVLGFLLVVFFWQQ